VAADWGLAHANAHTNCCSHINSDPNTDGHCVCSHINSDPNTDGHCACSHINSDPNTDGHRSHRHANADVYQLPHRYADPHPDFHTSGHRYTNPAALAG
jgi:hypothetical protein